MASRSNDSLALCGITYIHLGWWTSFALRAAPEREALPRGGDGPRVPRRTRGLARHRGYTVSWSPDAALAACSAVELPKDGGAVEDKARALSPGRLPEQVPGEELVEVMRFEDGS